MSEQNFIYSSLISFWNYLCMVSQTKLNACVRIGWKSINNVRKSNLSASLIILKENYNVLY